MAISTNGTVLARLAGGLYNTVMSNATYSEVASASIDVNALANTLYSRDFAKSTDLAVATTLLANLGLAGQAGLDAWVAAQLTAAGAANKGAKIVSLLNDFAALTTDVTWGTYASAFNTKVDAALAASQTTGSTTSTFDQAGVVTPTAQTYELSTSINSFLGTSLGDVFDASTTDSLSALDSIDGGAGNDTLNAALSSTTMPTFSKLTNIETIAIDASGAGFTIDTSTGYTGLTSLSVTDTASGAVSITGAATTALTFGGVTSGAAVTLAGGTTQTISNTGAATITSGTAAGAVSITAASLGAGTVAVTKGTDVTVTATGVLSGGSITVGSSTAAPTGAVVVTATEPLVTTSAAGAITVTGGTKVTVTQTTTSAVAANTSTATSGAVSVTGTSATTEVSVSQSTPVTAAAAKVAVASVASTSGSNTGAITTRSVAAVTEKSAIVAGAVTISDATATAGTQASTAGTISTVTLANFGSSTISSNALSTLNLSGTGGTLGITTGLTTPTNTTLSLNVNGLTGSTITDSTASGGGSGYTTLKIDTGATTASSIAQIAAVDVTALNVSGSNVNSFIYCADCSC